MPSISQWRYDANCSKCKNSFFLSNPPNPSIYTLYIQMAIMNNFPSPPSTSPSQKLQLSCLLPFPCATTTPDRHATLHHRRIAPEFRSILHLPKPLQTPLYTPDIITTTDTTTCATTSTTSARAL